MKDDDDGKKTRSSKHSHKKKRKEKKDGHQPQPPSTSTVPEDHQSESTSGSMICTVPDRHKVDVPSTKDEDDGNAAEHPPVPSTLEHRLPIEHFPTGHPTKAQTLAPPGPDPAIKTTVQEDAQASEGCAKGSALKKPKNNERSEESPPTVFEAKPKSKENNVDALASAVPLESSQSRQVAAVPEVHQASPKAPQDADAPPEPQPAEAEGPRRKSSVRFGVVTFREMTEHSVTKIEQKLSTHAVVIIIFIMVTVCVVMLLFVLLQPSSDDDDFELCSSPLCRDALKYLDRVSGRNKNPCDDFYAYVCNKWMKGNSDSSFLKDSARDLYDTINSTILSEDSDRPEHYGMHLFKAVYRVCYKFMNSRKESLGDILGLLQPEEEILRTTDDVKLLVWLMDLSLTRGLHSVFRVGFEKLGVGKEPYLTISPGESLRQKYEVGSNEKDFSSFLVGVIGGIKGLFENERLANDIVQLDLKVFELLTKKVPASRNLEIKQLGEFGSHMDAGAWLSKLNTLVPANRTLNDRSQLHAVNFEEVQRTLQTVYSVSAETRLLYLYLQIVSELLRFDYQRQYKIREGVPKLCVGASRRLLTRTWPNLIARLTGYDVNGEVAHMFNDIRNMAIKINYTSWMDDTTKERADAVLTYASIVVFPASHPSIDEAADYSSQDITGGNFLRSYLSLLAYEYELLLRVPPPPRLKGVGGIQLKGVLGHIEANETVAIVVPTASSIPPVLYTGDIPQYFNYGTVGALIAKELSEAVGPYPRGKKNPWWTRWGFNSIQPSMRCLKEQQTALKGTPQTGEAAWGLFEWSRSARIAYDAMRHHVKRKNDGRSFKQHWGDAQKVFFRRFCLLSCGYNSDPPMSHVRCNLPLMNMQEFATVFGCSSGQGMIPTRRCNVL